MKQGQGLFQRVSFHHSRKLFLVKQFGNELNSFSLRSLTAYPKCFCAGWCISPTRMITKIHRERISRTESLLDPPPTVWKTPKTFLPKCTAVDFLKFPRTTRIVILLRSIRHQQQCNVGQQQGKEAFKWNIDHLLPRAYGLQRWECYWHSCLSITVVILMTIFHTCHAHVIWSSSTVYEKGQQKNL